MIIRNYLQKKVKTVIISKKKKVRKKGFMSGIFSKKKKDKNLELTSEQQEEIKKMFETESFYSANE